MHGLADEVYPFRNEDRVMGYNSEELLPCAITLVELVSRFNNLIHIT